MVSILNSNQIRSKPNSYGQKFSIFDKLVFNSVLNLSSDICLNNNDTLIMPKLVLIHGKNTW